MTWKKIVPVPPLEDNTVHVWSLNLGNYQASNFTDILSAKEIVCAKRFVFAKDQDRFTIVRGVLRLLLAEYLLLSPAEIEFVFGAHGKPAISALGAANIQFNISHANSQALLAFTKCGDVGIDVEYIKENIDVEAIAARFFSTAEIKQLMVLPEEQRRGAFFNCWTRKEAFIKAIGVGLAYPLGKFTVEIESNAGQLLHQVDQDDVNVSDWQLINIPLNENYKAAIAASSLIESFKYYFL